MNALIAFLTEKHSGPDCMEQEDYPGIKHDPRDDLEILGME
jgi:hypothetical protein